MKRSCTRSIAIVVAAGLALSVGLLGCGGGKDTSTEGLAEADPVSTAAPAEASPVPAVEPEAAPAAPATVAAGNAEAAEPASPSGEPASAEAAAPSADSKVSVQNAAETDDLLALARSSANSAPGATGSESPDSSSGGSPARAAGNSDGGGAFGDPPMGRAARNRNVKPPEEIGDPPMGRAARSGNANPPGEIGDPPMGRGARGGNANPPGEIGDPPMGRGGGNRIVDPPMGDMGDPPMGGTGGGRTGGDEKAGPYDDPTQSAETFLAAVESKDPDRIADAVALRSISPTEGATQRHQTKYFKPILERSIEADIIDELASMFNSMHVVAKNNPKTTGELGVILGRSEEGGKFTTITLQIRREKAGWKVKDFSSPRTADRNPFGGSQSSGWGH